MAHSVSEGSTIVRPAPETQRRSELLYRNQVLRPGWGILLFCLALAAAVAAESRLLPRIPSAQGTRPASSAVAPQHALAYLVAAIAITAATWLLSIQERRRFSDYGFRTATPLRNLLGGALTGIALLSALVLLLHHLDLAVFRGQVLFGPAHQWRLAAAWLAFYGLVALVEETLIRGYLQYTLTRGLSRLLRQSSVAQPAVRAGFWMAATLLSVSFALLHRWRFTDPPMELVFTVCFGLLMAFSLWRTGSLWWALGFHLAWDWSRSFLWGLPSSGMPIRDRLFLTEAAGPALRSGGTTGPEGSLYALGALAAGVGILLLLHTRRTYPELWDEASPATFPGKAAPDIPANGVRAAGPG